MSWNCWLLFQYSVAQCDSAGQSAINRVPFDIFHICLPQSKHPTLKPISIHQDMSDLSYTWSYGSRWDSIHIMIYAVKIGMLGAQILTCFTSVWWASRVTDGGEVLHPTPWLCFATPFKLSILTCIFSLHWKLGHDVRKRSARAGMLFLASEGSILATTSRFISDIER